MSTQYISPKQTDIYFIVKNTSRQGKTIRIFGKTIAYGKTYDLLSLPAISEADIRESLVKGVLANRIRIGDIIISSSNIDLTQFSNSQKEFLISAGLTFGISNTTANNVENITALKSLSVAEKTSGEVCWVDSVKCIFTYEQNSTEAANDITVVSPTAGTGRWIRKITKEQALVIMLSSINKIRAERGMEPLQQK